jgi:hypothetical protein
MDDVKPADTVSVTLRQTQVRFVQMVGLLIAKADALGYELTLGDAYRDPRVSYGHQRSLHKQRLAIDLNLFQHGVFQEGTEAHRPLGEWWESVGGTWGGRFKDGNHYSLAWGGMK